MLDFNLASPAEVCVALGERLKATRQAKGIQQAELAARSGISRNTLLALESHGQGSMTTLVRVASALGIVDQLQSLFVLRIQSIAQLEAQTAPVPQRIRKPSMKTKP
ncbi:Helix-turn-helix domain-containing protein [Duganella sp. CF402]|uniref:helix-turn-helix domain-containing protein n=1 Tax=unclassified Duganella TaxID=2636909 RepID=UPI0008AC3994|nr:MULTISPECIES: helix-turn-helix transcriptional regulator [unclassified Duganella]RZT11403.1 helix-turn-helix protein [Duganella sp. BK701]SEK66100.1 Helix-turn-helix domain-containing protein [Duganella sp. CF402]